MIQNLPMWNVYLDNAEDEKDRLRFRVSDSDLDGFVRSIRFNNWIDGLTIKRELSPFDDEPAEYSSPKTRGFEDEDIPEVENWPDNITEEDLEDLDSQEDQEKCPCGCEDETEDDSFLDYSLRNTSPLGICYCPLGTNHPKCCINRSTGRFNYGPFEILING